MTPFAATILLTCCMISSALGACPEIVKRAAWGARAAPLIDNMTMPVSKVFIHHTAGAKCDNKDACSKLLKQIQTLHMDTKDYDDIGYSFLVGGGGRIYEGRGWKSVGAHTINYNSKSLGIAFIGNFEKELPSSVMLNAAKGLIDCGVEKGHLTKNREIHGHKDATCTACPGAELYKKIQGWPGFKGGKLKRYTC